MNRSAKLGALSIPAALLSPIVATAAAASANTPTLDVVERATSDAISVRGGTKPDNVGDVLTFHNEVFDKENKTKVGLSSGYCVRLIIGQVFECHWTLLLGKGQIAVDGPFYDNRDSWLAITGGTGSYSGAKGQMLLHALDSKGTSYRFQYFLK